MNPRSRVVIASSGVGHTLRGYEIFASTLFQQIRDRCHVQLYKGAGESSHAERRLPTLRRAWTRRALGDRRAENLEQVTFSGSLLLCLWAEDERCIVHVSEPWSARLLWAAKVRFGRRYTLLFTNGGGESPAIMQRYDFIHHNSHEAYEDALRYGIDGERMFFIPNAIDFSRFYSCGDADRKQLREKYGIPGSAVVVLSVGALNSGEKRIHHLITEVGRVARSDVFLFVVGDRGAESNELEELARQRLGQRYRFTTVMHERVHECYALADVYVHPAIREGAHPPFAVLEAIASRLPILVHSSEGFRWVTSDENNLVDMRGSGQAAARIEQIANDLHGAKRRARALATAAATRFDWSCVRGKYLGMYQAIAAHVERPGEKQ